MLPFTLDAKLAKRMRRIASRLSFSSLRVRLLLLVLLAVAPALGLMVYTTVKWRHHEAAEVQADALRMARLVSAHQAGLIEGAQQLLIGLARLPAVRQRDPAGCSGIFFALWKQSTRYANLGAITPDGKVFCSALPVGDAIDLANRPYFRRAVDARDFAIGDYQVGPIAGKATVNFVYPVLDKAGAVQAVVFAALDLAWLNELAADAQLPAGAMVTLMDQNGTILAHDPDPQHWVGQSVLQAPVFQAMLHQQREATAEGPGLDGIGRLFGFRPLLSSSQAENVYVAISIPTAVVFAEANRTLAQNLVFLGLAALLAIAAAWVGGDVFLVRRVQALVSATQRMSGGDLSARTDLPYGPGELSQLARSFDEMAAALQTRQAQAERAVGAVRRAHDELEMLVQERTADLVRANEALQAGLIERQRAESTLRKLSSAIEQTADSVFITNREGIVEFVNPAFEELTGYTKEDVIGQSGRIIKSGKHDKRFYEQLWETILSGEVFRAVFINRKKDGALYYEEKTITPLRDRQGSISHFVSAGRNITERMLAEAQQQTSREQLRALAARLESIREDERSRIAREIHDELGQALTALRIDLSRLTTRIPDDKTALLERTGAMITLVDATVESVRRIATELRPGILDDLGLEAAIEWQAQEFHERTGIKCQLTSSLATVDLDRELSTAVFRILQETLTNVARHANATRVEIGLSEEADRLILDVVDNGRGITDQEIADPKSLGLLGMRERAALLGGEVRIVGLPGEGTTVKAEISLKRPVGTAPGGAVAEKAASLIRATP